MRTLATIAIAANSSAALAQRAPLPGESVRVSLTHGLGSNVVEIDEEVTWTLAIHFEGFVSGENVNSINANLIPSDPSAGFASDMTYSQRFNGGTYGGLSDGLAVEGINFVNSLFVSQFTVGPDASNPLIVGTFTTTLNAPSQLTYTLEDATTEPDDIFLQIDISFFSWVEFTYDQVEFYSDTLVVPAPTSGVPLILATLFTTRRR